MSEKARKERSCAICKKPLSVNDAVPGTSLRDAVVKEIVRDHPDWSADSFICRNDLNRYRAKYVHSLLESEMGDLTSLEHEVLVSLQEHDVLTKNVDLEF